MSPSQSPALTWKVEGLGVSVILQEEVLGKLRTWLDQAPAGTEFGGILFGSVAPIGDRFQTEVTGFEAFPIEHRHGSSYTLSPRDQKLLEWRLQRLGRKGLTPVGFYRSHSRRGMYLDQRDFELFRKDFHHPSSVFLLVRRDSADDAKGAVFVWEEDDMRRHASYLEFALPAGVPVGAGVGVGAPLMPGKIRRDESLRHAGSANQWGVETAAKVALTLLLPLVAFYGAREMAFRSNFRQRAPRRPDPVPTVAAVLEQKPNPFPEVSLPAPAIAKVPAPPVERPADRVPRVAADSRDRAAAPPAAEVPVLPDPPAVAPARSTPSVPRIVASAPPPAGHPAAKVVAFIKPEPASSVRLAIQKVVTGHRPDEGFVAANAIEHPLPSPPRDAVPLEDGSTIEMVAKVDKHGNVVYVKVVDGNRVLADSSANALLRWRFEPARRNGAPVDSAMRIRFEFQNPSR